MPGSKDHSLKHALIVVSRMVYPTYGLKARLSDISSYRIQYYYADYTNKQETVLHMDNITQAVLG